MRKIIFLAAAILFILTATTCAARENVGVIIIGGAEFKTDDYYKIVKDELKPRSGAKILVGNDMQSRYQKYWLNRGYVGDQTPRRDDLISFTRMSGCGKVVCLVVNNSAVDSHNNAGRREKDRISVQVDAYICTPNAVAEVFTASCDSNSKTSNLRARRGAFRKCLDTICKSLNRQI